VTPKSKTWRTILVIPAVSGRPGRSGGYSLDLDDADASRLGWACQEAVRSGSQVRLRVERRRKGRSLQTNLRLLSTIDKNSLIELVRLLFGGPGSS